MQEINLSGVLAAARRRKKITQDELAAFLGVSKAAVSKWETGASYPDILLLPRLAAYFGISVDQLLDYKPQLQREEIRRLCLRLKADFSSRPFGQVYQECEELIKSYYACFPLLLEMAALYINHSSLAEDPPGLLRHTLLLLERIQEECRDVETLREAVSLKSCCHLMLQEPEKAVSLLEGRIAPMLSEEELLAQAYRQLDTPQRARELLQATVYQCLLRLLGACASLLSMEAEDTPRGRELLRRMEGAAELFQTDGLHLNISLQLCLTSAGYFCRAGDKEQALASLRRYAAVCTDAKWPLILHGDSFFDAIDGWLDQFQLGPQAPRDTRLIKVSLIQALEQNPELAPLHQEEEFRRILRGLKELLLP